MAVLGGIVSAIALSRKWLKVCSCAAFIGFGCWGMYAIIQQSNETAKSEAALKSALDEIGKSTQETARIQKLNSELQERILSQSKTITTLTKTEIKTVTGGNSICYVQLTLDPTAGTMDIAVLQRGNYPVSDVTMLFTDNDALTGDADAILSRQGLSLGTLSVGGHIRPTIIPPGKVFTLNPNGREKKFTASFSARNGAWDQLILVRKNEAGKWHWATRVIRNPGQATLEVLRGNQIVLYEFVDLGFPGGHPTVADWKSFSGMSAWCTNCKRTSTP